MKRTIKANAVGAAPRDEDLVDQAVPGHGVPSQDPDAAAQLPLDVLEAEREVQSTLVGGGAVAGMATGAAIGVAVAGPVGVLVGASVGAMAGALGGAAAGATTHALATPEAVSPAVQPAGSSKVARQVSGTGP
jgi:non-heme chloroperoxidase